MQIRTDVIAHTVIICGYIFKYNDRTLNLILGYLLSLLFWIELDYLGYLENN